MEWDFVRMSECSNKQKQITNKRIDKQTNGRGKTDRQINTIEAKKQIDILANIVTKRLLHIKCMPSHRV